MKKISFLLLLCVSSFSMAQQEVKVNVTDALVMKTFTASYEYYFSDQLSVGGSALLNFEGESSDFRYSEDQMFTAYGRHYFSTESLWNFFGEVFLAYNHGDDENGNTITDYSDIALGLVLGYKYISSGGFTVDIHAGLGRNLFTDDSPTIVPRAGVNIGYQF